VLAVIGVVIDLDPLFNLGGRAKLLGLCSPLVGLSHLPVLIRGFRRPAARDRRTGGRVRRRTRRRRLASRDISFLESDNLIP